MQVGTMVRPDTVARAAYQRLRELLLTGYFRPGQWLRERELSELLGISRTPLREALRMLERDEQVVSVPHRGFRIPVPTAAEMREFYELRAELEGMAARLAAVRAGPPSLGAMNDALTRSRAFLAEASAHRVIEENNRFHIEVARGAENRALEGALRQLRGRIDLYRVLAWSAVQSRPAMTQVEHEAIYSAIYRRDAPAAETAARRHILDSLEFALTALKAMPVEE